LDFTILHFAIHIVWRVNVICICRKPDITRKTTVAYPELRLLGNSKLLASSFFNELMGKFENVTDVGNGALQVGFAALGEILFQPYQPAISAGGGGSASKLGWGDDDKYKKKNRNKTAIYTRGR
jgi:hypothetical protein